MQGTKTFVLRDLDCGADDLVPPRKDFKLDGDPIVFHSCVLSTISWLKPHYVIWLLQQHFGAARGRSRIPELVRDSVGESDALRNNGFAHRDGGKRLTKPYVHLKRFWSLGFFSNGSVLVV